jgi:hypothetical protein
MITFAKVKSVSNHFFETFCLKISQKEIHLVYKPFMDGMSPNCFAIYSLYLIIPFKSSTDKSFLKFCLP